MRQPLDFDLQANLGFYAHLVDYLEASIVVAWFSVGMRHIELS